MLKHVVIMKLKEVDKKTFQQRILKLQTLLLALKENIDVIRNMEVGLNISSRPTAYDLILVSEFHDEKALDKYRSHPKHLEVLEFIREVVDDSKVVDYTLL